MSSSNRNRHALACAALIFAVGCALALPARAAGPDAAAAPASSPADGAKDAGETEIVLEGEDAEALLQRALAYWEARVNRSPEIESFYPTREQLGKAWARPNEGSGIMWTDYRVIGAYTQDDEGLVRVRASTYLKVMSGMRLPDKYRDSVKPDLAERWVRIDGTWYKRPFKGGLARFMKRPAPKTSAAESGSEADAAPTAPSATAAKD